MTDIPDVPPKKKRGPAFGHSVSEETRRKLSLARRGKPIPNNKTKFKPGDRPSPATEFKPGQAAHNRKDEDHSFESGGYKWLRTGRGDYNKFSHEHTLMAEKVLGRPLKPGEHVHHIDGDKRHNENSNFLISSSGYHRFIENAMGFLYKREVFGGLSHEAAVAEFHAVYVNSDRDLAKTTARHQEENICPSCKRVFITGGRGNAPHGTIFCERRECRHKARIRAGLRCKELSEGDRAHIAGIIDQIGSLAVVPRGDTISVKLSIWITPQREQLRDALIERTGIGTKGGTSWQIYADALESLLIQVVPHLWAKTKQANYALEVLRLLKKPESKADRSWQPGAVEKMRAMNNPDLADKQMTFEASV